MKLNVELANKSFKKFSQVYYNSFPKEKKVLPLIKFLHLVNNIYSWLLKKKSNFLNVEVTIFFMAFKEPLYIGWFFLLDFLISSIS